jgi:hypothetical protein
MTQYFHKSFKEKPKGKSTLVCDFIDGYSTGLYQRGKDSFVVVYGRQVDDNLSYAQACAKLGQALMHAAACNGLLDSRMKGER